MKLLFCTSCADVVKLDKPTRLCKCGSSKGKYLKDGQTAVISGEFAECIGIDNGNLAAINASEERTMLYNKLFNIVAFMYSRGYERILRREANDPIWTSLDF